MKHDRLALGLLGATLLLHSCGGSDDGSTASMDLVEVSNGQQILPHTIRKLDASGNPTVQEISIVQESDLLDNLTLGNPVLPVPNFRTSAELPSGSPGNHFMYAEFTSELDLDSVLDSSPGAQANSGLTGALTVIAYDPVLGTSSSVEGRAFVNGRLYAGDPVGTPAELELQTWVELVDGRPTPVTLPDGTRPGEGFPGTAWGGNDWNFNGSDKLVSPNTLVFVADSDNNLQTLETFPAGKQIRMRISTSVKSSGGRFLKRRALASSTVGLDTLRPEVATTPPPTSIPVVDPGNGDTDVDPMTSIRIEFTEPVQPLTIGQLMKPGTLPQTSAALRVEFGPDAQLTEMPFVMQPLSVFDLTVFEIMPGFSFPGEGPQDFQCGVFNRVDVTFNPGQFRDLSANTNLLGANTHFFVGEGPGIVNAPVTPDVIYVGRLGAQPGLSVVDLNGFGGGTGNPTFDPTLQTFSAESTKYPFNPNVRFQGGVLRPSLQPGTCTVNGGSAGVYTLSRDSQLNDLLLRSPLVTSVGDMMLGQALDGSFNNGPAPFGCQSQNGGNICAQDGFKLIAPILNNATMVPSAAGQFGALNPGTPNLACWAPHPNPPPLLFPPLCVTPYIGGQEPTQTMSPQNLLGPGFNPLGNPNVIPQIPPNTLLTPEQNAFFEGPTQGQVLPAGCNNFQMRQQVGHYLYLIDRGRREIVVINSNRMTVVDRIGVPDPTSLAMSPNLDFLAVTNQAANLVSFININPLSARFHEVEQQTLVGLRPRGIAWDPGNEDILVCNEGEDSVSIISAGSLTVRKVVAAQLSSPFDVAITQRQSAVFGFQRNVYFAYIVNRTGRVAIFESGPNGVNGWGYDDVVGVAPFTFRNPKTVQPDHVDLRSGCWIVHEGAIDIQTGDPGLEGTPALSNLVVESALIGQVPLNNGAAAISNPQFRDIEFGIKASIGANSLSGVPVDLAFDNMRNHTGLPNTFNPFSAGAGIQANGKGLVRVVGNTGIPNNTPAYLFVAVPNPFQENGVIDVLDIGGGGYVRVDVNPYEAGPQSIRADNVQVLMDYFRQ